MVTVTVVPRAASVRSTVMSWRWSAPRGAVPAAFWGRRFGGGVVGGGVFEGLGEALEGLPDEPELVVGAGVGVAVRVPAHGQALVGALDLGGAGIGRDTQDLVEIDGRHPRILIAAGAGRATK
jgi:hypothetical protein